MSVEGALCTPVQVCRSLQRELEFRSKITRNGVSVMMVEWPGFVSQTPQVCGGWSAPLPVVTWSSDQPFAIGMLTRML